MNQNFIPFITYQKEIEADGFRSDFMIQVLFFEESKL